MVILHLQMASPAKTSAEFFGQHVPGTLLAAGTGPAWADVLVEVYQRRRTEASLVVPAVAEPLVVLILAGSAFVEEREFGGVWTGRRVSAGEFLLTTTPAPYELRWLVVGPVSLETLHAYLGLPLLARAGKDVRGVHTQNPPLREVFGERDPFLAMLLERLRDELIRRATPSALFVQGIAQSLAVHLVRTYPAPDGPREQRRGGLPAFRLRKVTALLEAHLAEDLPLARLAQEAGYSPSHLSRLFKQTTGFSLTQYLTRLRMTHARRLLRETARSMIEIGLEVGYTNPSHFAHAFQRQEGITPSAYRQRD